MAFLLKSYQRNVAKYPYIAQGIQASVLMATGDAISQLAVEKQEQFDFRRSRNFLFVGFCGGLGMRRWYGFLSRFSSPNKTVNTLKKVSADQLIFAPAFIGVLIGSIGLLQGSKPAEITRKLKRDYTDILVANYKIWPAIQLVNFYFVPLNYQVLLVQIVAVAWNTYISFKTNAPSGEAIEENGINEPLQQAGISTILQATGDANAQVLIEKKNRHSYDYKRTLKFSVFGCLSGLVVHKWYSYLDGLFNDRGKFVNTMSKLAADQIVFAPLFLLVDTGVAGFMQEYKLSGVVKVIKRDFPDIIIANFKIWPAAHFINLYFFPLSYQLGFNSVIALGSNTYFCAKTYAPDKVADLAEASSEEVESKLDGETPSNP